MKKRGLVAAALTVVFVLALATPVFAMTHSATYEWDGTVDMEKQVGHLCNTGGEMKQTIAGDGKMEKSMDVSMSRYKLTVEDGNDFVTAEDAVNNLTVTSVVELCAPPKTLYTTTEYVYGDAEGWQDRVTATGEANPWWMYNRLNGYPNDQTLRGTLLGMAVTAAEEAMILDMNEQELQGLAVAWGVDRFSLTEYNELTQQIWAVQVEANPGYSGNVHQDFEAAYGSTYDGLGLQDEWDGFADQFGFETAANHAGMTVVRGTDYVGNYFNMEQHARTSDGVLKRFIDISSPFSGAYLMEDFEVSGESDVQEAFNMTNIPPGVDIEVLWYDLF